MAAAAAVLALTLGGCGGGGGSGSGAPRGSTGAGTPAQPSDPPPAAASPVTTPQVAPRATATRIDHRSPALRHLQAVLMAALRRAGPRSGALVVDLTSGATLFSLRAAVPRPPASLEKLYTTIALVRLLGVATRLHTVVLGSGHLGPHGVWRGDLYLRGDGDPTFGDGWYDHVYESDQGSSVAALAAELQRLGIRRVTGLVYGDGSRFDTAAGGPATAEAPDTPDYGGQMGALVFDHGATGRGYFGPAAFAAHELALTLRARHVFARAAARPRPAPRAAHPLASVASPPLPVLLKLMDVPSDDLFADLLTKQLGYHFLGRGTLDAGAEEIAAAIAAGYGLHPVIHDGSGLDRSDRSSPAQIVSLLRRAGGTATGQALEAALPITGVSGTVRGIGAHTPAQGRCVAKTGTLDYVTNLAGACAAHGGHQLVFAIMLDGPANWQGYTLLGRMVGAVAGY